MKKIYTLASALLLGLGVSFAQNAVNSAVRAKSIKTVSQGNLNQEAGIKAGKAAHQSIVGKSRTSSSVAKATPFYTHDFSATDATSWTPASDNANVFWTIDATGGAIPAASKFGASQGEFAWIDSDAAGNTGGAYDATITSPVINCSSQPSVSLSFKQIYTSYAEVTTVEVSNDGGANFTSFPCNTTGTDLGDDATPDVFTVNISSVAANQASVVVRIRIVGDWDWYWCIDDVALSGLDPYELSVTSPIRTQYNDFSGFYGAANVQMPKAVRDSIIFWAECSNDGGQAQDFTLNTKVNLGAGPNLYDSTGTHSYQFTPALAENGFVDTLYSSFDAVDGRHFPSNMVGTYTVTQTVASVISSYTEVNTSDNIVTSNFTVSDTTFAKERGFITHYSFGIDADAVASTPNINYIMGNAYHIPEGVTAKAKSISFAISNNTLAGTKYRVKMMKFVTGSGWVQEGPESNTYDSKLTDRPSSFSPCNKYITLSFPSAIELPGGNTYIACVERLQNLETTTATTNTNAGCVFAADMTSNNNVMFPDNGPGYIFAYSPSNGTYDNLPYSYSDTRYLIIRLNTVDCDMMTASTNVVQPTCNLSNGSVSVTVSGGVAPYSYAWSPIALGTNVAAATGLGAGTYNVVVTDKYGCAKTLISTLTNVGASTTVSTTFTQSTSCIAADGTAIVNFVSGPAITSYSWSNGQTTATAVSLDGGTYVVTYTNADGCKGTASQVVTETGAPALTLSATASTPVACFGGNGSVQVSLSGTPAYPVNFTLGTNSLSGSAPVTFTVAANTYALSAVDNNGCNFTASNFTLNQPTQLVNGTAAKTNINCYGEATGTITISGVSGGTTPYSYIWGGSATGTNTTGNIASLAAGTYTITVKDANNCAASGSIANQVLTQPATVVSLSVVDVLLTGTRRVKLNITGGVAPYSITSAGTTVSPSTAAAAGDVIVSLGAGGDRVIKVTDANGCFIEETALSVGLKEAASVNNLSVYPNPTENNVTISFNSAEAKNVTVKLVSLNGQEIFTQELPQFVGEYSKTVNLSTQAQGVYFLQIVSDKNVTTKKVVKL